MQGMIGGRSQKGVNLASSSPESESELVYSLSNYCLLYSESGVSQLIESEYAEYDDSSSSTGSESE
jgi:hypothetical protein